MGPEQYLFITPVWGDAYVERFVKVSLPSQLSEGNLGAVPRDKALYLIYTRREHLRTITRSPAYRQLKSMLPVSVRSLDDLPDPRLIKNPHELQTAAYQRGIRAGEGKETAFVFLTPDILVGDGTFRNMIRHAGEGRRVQLVAGIRMLTEGAVSCIVRNEAQSRSDVAIPCRELVRAALDNMHPISLCHVVHDGRVFAAQHLYWKIGNHGLLARGFHLHPLLVWPRHPEAVIRNTLDDEYVSRACPDRKDWHVVTDSDDLCVIEFSDRNHKTGMVLREKLSDAGVAAFLYHCTTPDHRDHVLSRIRFLAREIEARDWSDAEAESDALVHKYLDLHARVAAPANAPAASEEHVNRIQVLVRKVMGPARGTSTIQAVVSGLTLPFRVLNRVINFKLYRYADRLNAEILLLKKRVDQAHHRLAEVSEQIADLQARLADTEQEARFASVRAAEAASRSKSRRRKRPAVNGS